MSAQISGKVLQLHGQGSNFAFQILILVTETTGYPPPFLVDTHAHLYVRAFDTDRSEVIHRMRMAGVGRAYLPNIDLSSVEPMMALCRDRPGVCFPMLGLHPCHVEVDFEEVLDRMKILLEEHAVVAIGEIGLDAYWDKTSLPRQESAFRQQLRWGLDRELPVVIHSRETLDDCIRIVGEEGNGRIRGIFHCFTGDLLQAERIAGMGMYIGIGGVYTYNKSHELRDVLSRFPLDHVVLETDAPYLAPVPFRGKRNEPAYVRQVAEALAADRDLTLEEFARITSRNADLIFRFSE